MSTNSFLLKGWAVTLMAGIFILSSKDTNQQFFLMTFLPALIFWGLDSYYLHQEKLYRYLYNNIRLIDNYEQYNDKFTLQTDKIQDVPSWVCLLFSKTILPFYGILISGIIILYYIMGGR
ncbi:MAG: hypothetical protein C0391_00245 [Anaerolinea sp.]|nr:hypothetical protein [Anaerolinea sp.]